MNISHLRQSFTMRWEEKSASPGFLSIPHQVWIFL